MFHHFSSTLSHSHFINGLARTRAVVLVPGLTAAMDDENNVDTPADSIVLEEEIDPDYVPTQKEVEESPGCMGRRDAFPERLRPRWTRLSRRQL